MPSPGGGGGARFSVPHVRTPPSVNMVFEWC
jgi:hypothetical protein